MDYNLGDIISIRLEDGVFPLLEKQFSYWKSGEELDHIDLSIGRGKVNTRELIRATNNYSFFDGGFVLDEPKGRIEFNPGNIIIEGVVDAGRVEGIFIAPWINQILLQRGWCLAHASAIVYHENTIIFPAMTRSGKTTIMLEFLSRGADFLGDDRVMIGENGELALYPRFIHMLEYNWSLFPELFENAFPDKNERRENERRLSKCRKGMTMNGGNPLTKCLKQYYSSRYSYDVWCRPELMFPHSRVILKSRVNWAFFLESCDMDPTIVNSSPSDLARMSVSSYMIEASRMFRHLCFLAGIDSLDYYQRIKTVEDFYEKAKCFEVRVKNINTRADAGKIVDKLIDLME